MRSAAQLLALTTGVLCCAPLGGCLGDGGAVTVRWRIVERETGRIDDPRDDSDANGVCCQLMVAGSCTDVAGAAVPGWHIERVQLVLSDPSTGTALADPPAGLDTKCSARELTTPFSLPGGLYAITLRAYNRADPTVNEAQSPLPEIRTVKKAEIVQLDVVELSVSAGQSL